MAYLSLIVLIPLAAVVDKSLEDGFDTFWTAVTNEQAVAALKLTLIASAVVAAINAVTGTLIAWVLVRDEFRGKGIVNSLIDLPFALPTIVAGLTLLALYGPRGPVGIDVAYTKIAVILALLFVTLPFVVRAVQPVLIELDREMEEAAASLGAEQLHDLPAGDPAEPAARDPGGRGAGLRPLDRRVRLAGADHREPAVRHRGRLGVHLRPDRERPRDRRGRRVGRAARDLAGRAARDLAA